MYTSLPPPKNGKEIFKVPSRTDVGSQSTGIDSFWNTHRREGFGSKLSPLPFHSVHTPHINLSTSYLSPAMCTIVGGWKRTPPSPKKKYNNRRNLNYAGRRPPIPTTRINTIDVKALCHSVLYCSQSNLIHLLCVYTLRIQYVFYERRRQLESPLYSSWSVGSISLLVRQCL